MNHPNPASSRSGAPPRGAPDEASADQEAATTRGGRKLAEVPARKPAVADRITISLVPKAAADLQKAYDRTHMSKTDIINRALSLYEFVEGELSEGAELIIRRDGRDHYVKFL